MKHPLDRAGSSTASAVAHEIQNAAFTPGEFQFPEDAACNAIFDSSAEALLLVDAAGLIRRANRRAKELLRLKDSRSFHASLEDVLPVSSAEAITSLCAAGALPAVPLILDTSLITGFPVRIALRSILPGSHQLLLCLEEGPVIQRAEAKWRQAHAELRTVLDSVQSGIVLFDPAGRMRHFSARFGEIFGLDARQLKSINNADELDALISGRFRRPEAFSAPWKSFAAGAGDPGHDELEIVRPFPRMIERFYRPVTGPWRHALGWLEIYSDVTERRQNQSKILQAERISALGPLASKRRATGHGG